MSAGNLAEPVTVIVADDQSAVREGLVLLLGTLPGIVVAGVEAADGNAAADLVAEVQPQVVLMDLNMPGSDGVSATRRITAEHPGTCVSSCSPRTPTMNRSSVPCRRGHSDT